MQSAEDRRTEVMLERERIANRKKHWVRLVTACNSHCLFCLDSDTPRNVYLPVAEVKAELDRGRSELNADKVILSGGEGTLHPKYFEFVRYAKSIGYDRVQSVTNGWNFADKDFYEEAVEAGVGEITFSLHGHTLELHEKMTAHPGSFPRICKAIMRASRDPRMICNIDTVINGMNVEYIDKIIELGIRLGVYEYDLLHVIPQADAFVNRDTMFYDVREYLPKLHKVFRLNRHPRFYIWTNRFPVHYLEGLEELIQDPHKMIDEVNGRRYQVMRYLDSGEVLDCRQPERCVHCFIEPFCTTVDRVVADKTAERFEVFWVGDDHDTALTAPPGAKQLGVNAPDVASLQAIDSRGLGLYAQVTSPGPIPPADDLVLVATTPAHLEAWIDAHRLVVHLTEATASWMLAHRDRVEAAMDRLHIHQPSYEHMASASAADVREPAAFFRTLDLPVQCSGLPACMAPNTTLVDEPAILPAKLFKEDTGRLHWKELARYHIGKRYRAKSVRCSDCRLADRCEGPHINLIRDQGLRQVDPLIEGPWADEAERQLLARWPSPPSRLGNGRPAEPVAASLPGFAPPDGYEMDPLALIGLELQSRAKRKEERDAKRSEEKAE